MALSNLLVRALYQGDGTTDTFAIPFDPIVDDSVETKVYIRDETVADSITETLQVEGEFQDYVLANAPSASEFHTDVVFNAGSIPTATQKVLVIRELPLTQVLDLIKSGNFNPETLEETLDRIVAMVQQLNERLGRTPYFAKTNALDIQIPDPVANGVWVWNEDADGMVFKPIGDLVSDLPDITSSLMLAAPSDGDFGDQFNLADLQVGDSFNDAFDKVNTFLEKLAPELPPNLSAVSLSLAGAYTALTHTSGVSRSTVTSSSTPTVSSAEEFFNGVSGVLSATIGGVAAGSIALTSVDNSGTDDQLTITANDDFHDGVFGKEGFWWSLEASITPGSALSLGETVFVLAHSLTGSSSLNVYRDDPGTPSISGQSVTGSGTGRLVSGVPSLANGDTITAAFDADDVVSEFYNSTRIGRAECSVTNSLNAALPGSPPAKGATVPISIALTVQNNQYTENASVTVRAYASNGTQANAAVTNNIRVDTVSNESARLVSGEGQYPSSGYGGAFSSSTLLTASGNEELQMLNGRYQYPAAVNYSSNTPTAGPNYSSIAAGSWSNMRWATFSLGSISSATSVNFSFSGAQNFGSTTIVTNFALYVKVEGVTGWLDANAAYPGVGSPSSNGDAALDVGNSSATSKRVTFGSTARTGTVYVRVGIPQGNNKAFSGVS